MEDFAAQVKFLDEASQLLLPTSPSISAYLQIRQRDIREIHDMPPKDKTGQDICRACGSILIPGWSSRSLRRSAKPSNTIAKPQRKRKRDATDAKLDSDRIECLRCHSPMIRGTRPASRTTSSHTQSPHQAIIATKIPTVSTPATAAPVVPSPVPTSAENGPATLNRKKRARGKDSSLQAMLAKSKSEKKGPQGFGLDLMDLMQA